jgi:serine protease Do
MFIELKQKYARKETTMLRYLNQLLSIIMVYLTLLLAPAAFAAIPVTATQAAMPSLAPMLKGVMPAVVNVSATRDLSQQLADEYEQPAQSHPDDADNSDKLRAKKMGSMGSGVIIDAENGYILTNAHVVYKADAIHVKLHDGRISSAKLIGTDRASDVAVIQINEKRLSALRIGDSEQLQVGDFVLAIGNPFGLTQTVTSGIVSGLQRSNLGIGGHQSYENFIQTDASINPGNSGGALVNLRGELVGINTAILGKNGASVGIGFAIPIDMAVSVMHQLVEHGNVSRGLLGFLSQSVTPELAKALKLKTQSGAITTYISPNSPAALAGIQIGDVIESINHKPVKDSFQLRNIVGLLQIGEKIRINYIRNGKNYTTSTVIADPKQQEKYIKQRDPFLHGISLKEFDQQSPALGHVKGIAVLNVGEDTPAAKAKMMPGDIILAANNKSVTTLEELQTALKAAPERQVILRVLRESGVVFMVLERA